MSCQNLGLRENASSLCVNLEIFANSNLSQSPSKNLASWRTNVKQQLILAGCANIHQSGAACEYAVCLSVLRNLSTG